MAASSASGQTLQVTYEHELGAYRYRFENPSTFDTAQLVPHFFEQKYDTNNDWLVGRLAYGGRLRGETEAGLSRNVPHAASDVDTFDDPSGDVITSGTTGGATMHAWRVRQTIALRTWGPASAGPRLYVGYAFRRDTADFLTGNKSVTHTSPPSADYSTVTTRETTHSDVHDILIGVTGGPAGRRSRNGGGWSFEWNVDAIPATFARLTVLLPDKYPGQPLRFMATAVGGEAGLTLRRRAGSASIDLGVRVDGARSYLHASQFSRHAAAASAGVSW